MHYLKVSAIGLVEFMAWDTPANIIERVTGAIGIKNPPAALTDPELKRLPKKKSIQLHYHLYMAPCNRVYIRLILCSFGYPLCTPHLTTLQCVRDLLSSFIGHSSLFFHERILQHDASANDTT